MSTPQARGDDPGDMAWPRDEAAEPSATPEAEPLSTRDAEREVKKALADRQPHVAPRRTPGDPSQDPEVQKAEKDARRARQREADPIFVLMVVGAISIGLTPVDATVRYVILWTLLAAAGLFSYTLGSGQRLSQPTINDLTVGLGFGIGAGVTFFILLGAPLASISDRMFAVSGTPEKVIDTWVFMAVVFVQPAADSLFFRGAIQQFRSMILTALLATLWTIVLFFPHMELAGSTGVAATIGLFFAFLNFLYGYVCFRNGLAAAWVCQMIAGALLWFAPRLLF